MERGEVIKDTGRRRGSGQPGVGPAWGDRRSGGYGAASRRGARAPDEVLRADTRRAHGGAEQRRASDEDAPRSTEYREADGEARSDEGPRVRVDLIEHGPPVRVRKRRHLRLSGRRRAGAVSKFSLLHRGRARRRRGWDGESVRHDEAVPGVPWRAAQHQTPRGNASTKFCCGNRTPICSSGQRPARRDAEASGGAENLPRAAGASMGAAERTQHARAPTLPPQPGGMALSVGALCAVTLAIACRTNQTY